MTRIVRWDGCVNVRDLGGLPLRGGGETRYRVVVRADSLRTLTEEGRRALVDYGVTRAIDLRHDGEVAGDAPGDLPVPVVRLPIETRHDAVIRDWPTMREVYEALLERFQSTFARAVAELARGEPPVAVHCAGGRDRTGLVCGLVSWLAGVEPDAIASDHALSDDSWEPYNAQWWAEAPDEAERDRRRRISLPAGRTMVDVLERLGDVRGYLLAGGASPDELDTIVVRLRGSTASPSETPRPVRAGRRGCSGTSSERGSWCRGEAPGASGSTASAS